MVGGLGSGAAARLASGAVLWGGWVGLVPKYGELEDLFEFVATSEWGTHE